MKGFCTLCATFGSQNRLSNVFGSTPSPKSKWIITQIIKLDHDYFQIDVQVIVDYISNTRNPRKRKRKIEVLCVWYIESIRIFESSSSVWAPQSSSWYSTYKRTRRTQVQGNQFYEALSFPILMTLIEVQVWYLFVIIFICDYNHVKKRHQHP